MSEKHYCIAGDIGGTNARLALYSVTDDNINASESQLSTAHTLVFSKSYKNDQYESFTAVVEVFLETASDDGKRIKLSTACFAVAGPVSNNIVRLTNRGEWNITATDLERKFGINHVRLVNDFVANGYGLLTLDTSEYTVVREGKPDRERPIALIGAGTGLGECFLAPDNGRYIAYPSEGGHVEYPPGDELEVELLQYLQRKFGHDGNLARISAERIVSGKGIENVYEFLVQRFPDKVDERKHKSIMEADESAKEISMLAYDYGLARQAMEIMMKAYGGETGNVGLKFLPTGGLYIAGGIAPHNMQYIKGTSSLFMKAYWNKGRVSSILEDVPVRVVMSEDLGLRGAHVVAARMLADHHAGKQSPGTVPHTPSTSSYDEDGLGAVPAAVDLLPMFFTSLAAAVSAVVISHMVLKAQQHL
eukprot:TRINITY_DN8663_c0_g1_i2.p1 TRINITY_DN8663_c0_g1~~TRINITY_DN8663_c0_g1_i2.p1  ORF type:complete len:419 (+),score=108.56 TRINITY_DN8663_c0_g1_i2:124-1380(+)